LPYHQGGVPREPAFNANVLAITADPKMPKLVVDCDAVGFDVAATRIIWRLQTLYVVGRYRKMSGGSTPHYRSRVLSLGDTWTGDSSAAKFTLFDGDANVAYDNRTDRVVGGHAILAVAARPAGSAVWLQDYVHLRITGINPTETIVRKYVRDALADRNKNIECMADAVFAWENAMQQFDPQARTHTTYKGVRFDWSHDPPKFPSVAFDYGIGFGQFTHPGKETVGICWDWRDNLDAGMNELLDDLRATFAAGESFIGWAKNAWSMYNTGSAAPSSYATRLANSPDGKRVDATAISAGLDRNRECAHVPGRPAALAPRRAAGVCDHRVRHHGTTSVRLRQQQWGGRVQLAHPDRAAERRRRHRRLGARARPHVRPVRHRRKSRRRDSAHQCLLRSAPAG
jgi:hypothetical protein